MDGMGTALRGVELVAGTAEGDLLFSDTPLSFWGGIDPATGEVIDANHPLFGKSVSDKVLAIPGGRGSCTGSSVMMQLILNGCGPLAMVFARKEDILTLGIIVADELFGTSIPALELSAPDFERLSGARHVRVEGGAVHLPGPASGAAGTAPAPAETPLHLSARDEAMLGGQQGEAAQAAMRIITRMAGILGASELVDVTQAHIDGCIYTGPASLEFALKLCRLGARVAVPTTLNAISVDQRRWREQGTDASLAEPASALADAYVAMGARPTFTCAPYLLETAPAAGEDIVWAESNAVVYANSVLGARTMKYPDYLDICIALTGRAPLAGCHIPANRKARIRLDIDLSGMDGRDDSFYPLLGYHAGLLAPSVIPVLTGLGTLNPTRDDLKAFGAAFGTTSGAPMFHILGVTPEADTLEEATGGNAEIPTAIVTRAALAKSWRKLDAESEASIDLVSLGNPHFSQHEFEQLARLCEGRKRGPETAMVITTGRETVRATEGSQARAVLERFGATIVTDACWCTVSEPVIPPHARTIMTNSAKYAHYGPGLSGRSLRFGSLAACVEAACTGKAGQGLPGWLVD